MRVVLQQVDLDTCLTGLLLGVGEAAEVTVARDGAAPAELADPAVRCIEASPTTIVASDLDPAVVKRLVREHL